MKNIHHQRETGISVLIRTFNSAKTLGQVLSRLKLADGDEYVIVDSGSDDQTLAISAEHHANIVRAEGKFHYSKSLNLGFASAKNPWVLVISSHAIPMVPDMLAVYRTEMQNFSPDVVVAYGDSTITGISELRPPMSQTVFCDAADIHMVVAACGNANALYRKIAWEKLPFDETIITAEDKIWLAQALRGGGKAAYVPFVPTRNQSQYSLRYMFYKAFRDVRAGDHRPMPVWRLAWGLAGMTKKFVCGQINCGSYIRVLAHIMGQFFGSYAKQKNSVFF
jgi:glycosyltransferase involved in cell wall biosynthesis